MCISEKEKEKEILTLIETLIKKGNANIKIFASNLISNLKINNTFDNLKIIIEKKLNSKNIYFIRHAEALHNVLEAKYPGDFSKCNVYDPELTEKGKEQTDYIMDKLKKNKIHFDSIYISPLTRAIQTYFLLKKELNDDAEIIITDFVSEFLSYCDKNKGIKLSKLREKYKNENFNFEYMTKEYWWFNLGENKEDEFEGKNRFNLRLNLFILWIVFREGNNILIISHNHVFKNLQGKGINNADMVKMDNKLLFNGILSLLNFNAENFLDDGT